MTRELHTLASPLYTHDCTKCRYLGADFAHHGERLVNQVDNYIHLNPSGRHTLIRRFSSEPADYLSFRPTEVDPNRIPPSYKSVLDLAKTRGYI